MSISKCTGAGIILINNKKQLILFRSKNNLMNELGGTRNNNEDILTTAIREAYEESFLTVNIDKSKLKKSKFYDLHYDDNNKYYRCFFYHIDDYERSLFLSQKDALYYLKNNGATIPEYYFETIDVDYFNINDIDISKTKSSIKNIKNKKCKIRERTFNCIINGLKNNLL